MTTTDDLEQQRLLLRQGQVGWLRLSHAPEIQESGGEKPLVVVISHDCDIASLEEEELEFLRAELLEGSDGNLTYGKNPRRLQMRLSAQSFISVRMADRFRLPRDRVVAMAEYSQLDHRELYTLQRWMAGRYNRSAFPDNFNNRRRPAKDAIRRIMSKGAHELSGLYVAVSGDELGDQESYEILLVGAVPVDAYDDSMMRTRAEKVVADVAMLLDEQPGIVVADFLTRSESQISLDDLIRLQRLDFDDLSVRPNPVGPTPRDS